MADKQFKWKTGYCPVCNRIISLYTDQHWTKCPVCKHRVSLKEGERREGE